MCFSSWICSTQARVDWRASFGLQLGSSYNLPDGVGLSSYVTFDHILFELKMSHQNEKKITALAQELSKNTASDFLMKMGLVVNGVLFIVAAFPSQLKKIKEIAKERRTQTAAPIALPMYQAQNPWSKIILVVETKQKKTLRI